jgi:hypothetical protein
MKTVFAGLLFTVCAFGSAHAQSEPLTADTMCRDIDNLNPAFMINVMTAQIKGRMHGEGIGYTTKGIINMLNKFGDPTGGAGLDAIQAGYTYASSVGGLPPGYAEQQRHDLDRAHDMAVGILPTVIGNCHRFPFQYTVAYILQYDLWKNGYDDEPVRY